MMRRGAGQAQTVPAPPPAARHRAAAAPAGPVAPNREVAVGLPQRTRRGMLAPARIGPPPASGARRAPRPATAAFGTLPIPAWVVVPMLLATACPAAEPLLNRFDDPFFRITADVADCIEPAGPRITEAEHLAQSHHRAEKGTTCWLAGACAHPNAYAYDRGIAAAIRAAIANRSPFPATTLWVTVQGRVVFVEGCVADRSDAGRIEAFMRRIDGVQQAVAIVTTDPRAPAPYRPFAPLGRR